MSRSKSILIEFWWSLYDGRFPGLYAAFATGFVRVSSRSEPLARSWETRWAQIRSEGQSPPASSGALRGAGTSVTWGPNQSSSWIVDRSAWAALAWIAHQGCG